MNRKVEVSERMEKEVLFLNDEEVKRLLSREDVLNCVENTFKSLGNGRIRHPKKEPLWLDDTCDNMLLAMPGWLMDKNVAGVKWVNMYFNQIPGLPASLGNLIVLNHADCGVPYALIEASSITTMRTGGGHAIIAAKYLAKKDPKVLTVIGCGEEGQSAVRSALLQFNLEKVKLCDLSEKVLEKCREEFGTQATVETFTKISDAVKGSDIVILATTCKKVLFTETMAEPGMTVIGLNAFYDLDFAFASGKYRWFLGNKESDQVQIIEDPDLSHCGLAMENVTGDLGEVVTGKVAGRKNEDEIIVYTHMGMGSLDLACADLAYQRANEKSMGQILVFKG